MKCRDVRWQLSEFLSGATSPVQDDLIRAHLDQCSDCALRLVSSGRVDAVDLSSAANLTVDITRRVLAYFPESPSGRVMIRHLSWAFLVSAGFAVGVFLSVRRMLAASSSTGINPISQFGESGLDSVAAQLTANPVVNYIALAALATALCVALIVFIDRPSNAVNNTASTKH